MTAKTNHFAVKAFPPFSAAASAHLPASDDPRETIAYERFDYVHSEEYTEWGEVAIVFIWTAVGALPRAQREKFIATALTGDGKARKLTSKNVKTLWPNAPKDWKDIHDSQR